MLGQRSPVERIHTPRPVFRDDCLAGRSVFVTGASSGIGRAVAVALAAAGARLSLSGRDESRLEETRVMLAGAGHDLVPGALTDADAAADLLKEASRRAGPFDGVFHAAGSFQVRPLKITKQRQLDAMFDASVFGAYGIGRAASGRAVMADGGSLVFMSSVAAEHGAAGLVAYSGAKAAVLGLTRSLALELAPRLVRVNAIAASTIVTEMHERTMENADMTYVAKNEERHPLGFGRPGHISDAALFLLSDAAVWITGTTLPVDGGYSAA